jgi:hypothetical protein
MGELGNGLDAMRRARGLAVNATEQRKSSKEINQGRTYRAFPAITDVIAVARQSSSAMPSAFPASGRQNSAMAVLPERLADLPDVYAWAAYVQSGNLEWA